MHIRSLRGWGVVLLMSLLTVGVYAQAPTGAIAGTVADQSGAVIPNANVTVTDKATGTARSITTNNAGLYSAPALPAGEYEVRAEAPGFKTMLRNVTVTAGNTATVDMQMSVGQASEVVSVEASAAQVNYESHTIAGTIARNTIQDLPINGRSFLSLATLEPGVTTSPGVPAQFNSLVNITTLGGGGGTQGAYTRLTIDGGIVNDEWEGSGSTSMNFSQEVVQEFQLSTVNFDITSGIGAGGQLNIVTRSGTNDFHGSGYFFFRDHNMAAYPGLKRPTDPTNFYRVCAVPNSPACKAVENPFFVRRNPGFWVGGPIKKDKLFFFFNYEYQNQVQAYAEQQDLPSLAPLSAVFLSPYHIKEISARFDYNLSPKHTMFLRYSHDGNLGFGPYGGVQPLQSSWSSNDNWSDQSIIGLTSILTNSIVNDLRFQYHWWRSLVEIANASQCAAPCITGGLPSLVSMIGSSTFYGGVSDNSPQPRQARVYEIVDNVSWQKGSHRIRFGGDYERIHTNNDWEFCSYGCLSVYSPETTRTQANPALLAQYLPNLPSLIASTADVLALPVFNTTSSIYSGIDVGPGNFPGPYERDRFNHNDRPKFYIGDTWKVSPNLTVNGALGWEFETGLWYQLPFPAILKPILGNNLNPPPTNYHEFSPQLGFAYAVGKSKKTVIRGGAGLFWDSEPLWHHFRAGASLGPVGNGRTTLTAGSLTNIFPNIVNLTNGQPLPIGAPLPLNTLTNMTLAQFIQIYNQQLPQLQASLAPTPPTSGPFTVSGLDVAKTAVELHPPNFNIMKSYQTNLGVQRELPYNMVLDVNWARRQFENVDLGELDLNRFARPSGPVIPKCATSQLFVPGQQCSSGSVTFWVSEGRTIYEALLVKLQKRLSNHVQATVSYALENQNTVIAPTLDLNNYFATYGNNVPRHIVNVAILGNLPWGFQLTVNNQIISRSPVEPVLAGIPLTAPVNKFGSSTTVPIQLAIPSGLDYNCFGVTCGKSDLQKLVSQYNSTYGGNIQLPARYQFGDPRYNTDVRLTKMFTYKERYNLSIFGEVFNAFNIANLTGYSFVLGTSAFGQPTARVGQVFGSGGPRAFQVGTRVSF